MTAQHLSQLAERIRPHCPREADELTAHAEEVGRIQSKLRAIAEAGKPFAKKLDELSAMAREFVNEVDVREPRREYQNTKDGPSGSNTPCEPRREEPDK